MKEKIINLFEKVFLKDIEKLKDESFFYKVLFVRIVIVISCFFLFLFSIQCFFIKKYLISILEFFFFIFLISFFYRIKNSETFLKTIKIAFYGNFIFFMYFVVTGGVSGYGFVWSYFFPASTLFMLGIKESIKLNIFFYLGNIFFLFSGIIKLPSNYTLNFKLRYLGSYFLIFFVSFFYEYIKNIWEKKVKQKNIDISNNMNELKLTWKAFKESENKYKVLVEKANDIIIIIQDNVVKFANKKFYEILKYSKEDVLGDNFLKFVSLKDSMIFNEFLENPKNTLIEIILLDRYNNKIITEVSSSIIKYNNKIANILIIRNITERKNIEIKNKNLELQLFQTQKLETIGNLAGGVAHDINNMLGTIIGSSELVKEKLSNNNFNIENNVDSILNAAKHSSTLTSNLLAFSRKGDFNVKLIDINNLINSVIMLLENTIPKNIKLLKNLNLDKCYIKADETQIENILINLAINSKDAIDEKQGKIIFETQIVHINEEHKEVINNKVESGEYVEIKVIDNGSGIDDEILPFIFDPFFTTKEVGKGTRLGLSGVYGIIKKNKGFIDIETELEKGTTFKLYFRLVVNEKVKEIMEIKKVKGSGNIIVIDDDELINETISEIVRILGYNVVSFTEVLKAIEYYKNNFKNIDIIIMDMIMPELNGKECFKKLKEINNELKVIISSGYSENENVKDVLNNGAIEFIQKPFDINEISEVLSRNI